MIYFDNAATTPLLPEVIGEMNRIFNEVWGNPSSIHSIGQIAKSELENARNNIANLLSAKSSEIYFTSSATEAISLMIPNIIQKNNITKIISSPIEHSAVLKTIANTAIQSVQMVELNPDGSIILEDLEQKLKEDPESSLVILMHANNEIGTLLPLKKVSELCKQHHALFFCDMVQTIGKYDINFEHTHIDFAVASAHKFHGPKGSGLLYIKSGKNYPPMIYGGGQERNLRSGTENLPAIVGMSMALKLAVEVRESRFQHISALKTQFINELKNIFPDIKFHGNSNISGLYSLVNISLPAHLSPEIINMKLDLHGLAASQGSACSSGILKKSAVISHLYGENKNALRISFSYLNTFEEVAQSVKIISQILH
jgi:cysteine desulfurase